jgi:peroxiredoxin
VTHPREKPDYGMGRTAYRALIGVLLAAVVIIVVINLLSSRESGTVGLGAIGIGKKVEPFAIPEARSDLDGDANVDPDRACAVDEPGAIRICDFFGEPLIIYFWFTRGAAECIEQHVIFDRVASRFEGQVGALSVNVRDDRDRVRGLISERGWTVPVGHDRDGAVSNLYRVGGCPTFLFVNSEGYLVRAEVGRTTYRQLSSQVRSFLRGKGKDNKTGSVAR